MKTVEYVLPFLGIFKILMYYVYLKFYQSRDVSLSCLIFKLAAITGTSELASKKLDSAPTVWYQIRNWLSFLAVTKLNVCTGCKLRFLSVLQIFIFVLWRQECFYINPYLKFVDCLVIGQQNRSFVLIFVICRPLICTLLYLSLKLFSLKL